MIKLEGETYKVEQVVVSTACTRSVHHLPLWLKKQLTATTFQEREIKKWFSVFNCLWERVESGRKS